MTDNDIKIIQNEIIPAIENGNAMLFIGAAFSIGTPTEHSKIPSSARLRDLICDELNYKDSSKIDLQDAFKLGKRRIENFENFLFKIFNATKPLEWQIDLLRYWWRGIYSTNIDTVLEKSVQILSQRDKNSFPEYAFFGHKDKKPITSGELERTIIKLHGCIKKPEDGFIFDRASYAEFTAIKPDWLREAAANIASGSCLFLGSRFKESDLEVAIAERELIHANSILAQNNWIVLRSFKDYEKDLYEEQGIIPITADVSEFVNYITQNLKPLSQKAFLKKRLPHLHISDSNIAYMGWFAHSFFPVDVIIEKSTNEHCLKGKYYYGDPVDWKYIVNDVPAELSYSEELLNIIKKCEKSDTGNHIINITGPVCCGKSTAAMQTLKKVSLTNKSTYIFSSVDGIDIELFWRAIKDLKGTFIFYFDNGYENFYAIDEIINRGNELPGKRTFIFMTESRLSKFEYHQRHFKSVTPDMIHNFEVSSLETDDARKIIKKIDQLGVAYTKFDNKNENEKIQLLIDKREGYGGDLFAALYDLSSSKSYEKQIEEEYEEIEGNTQKFIYSVLALATAVRIYLPLNYLMEICDLSANKILHIFNSELKGKIKKSDFANSYSIRHHSLAIFIIKNLIAKGELTNIIIKILNVVSTKFTISDIKNHPLPFRIYRELISYRFITDVIYSKNDDIEYIYNIYNVSESLFNKDAFFWLQYGRFHDKQQKYDDAIFCLRTGISRYETPHLLHALGHVLLKKYIFDGLVNNEELQEGLDILSSHLMQYGKSDSYFATTLLDMISQIIEKGKYDKVIAEKAEFVVNSSSHHITAKEYNRSLQRFIKARKENPPNNSYRS